MNGSKGVLPLWEVELYTSHEDIQQFINNKIDRDDNSEAMDDKLRAEIEETITSRSEGM